LEAWRLGGLEVARRFEGLSPLPPFAFSSTVFSAKQPLRRCLRTLLPPPDLQTSTPPDLQTSTPPRLHTSTPPHLQTLLPPPAPTTNNDGHPLLPSILHITPSHFRAWVAVQTPSNFKLSRANPVRIFVTEVTVRSDLCRYLQTFSLPPDPAATSRGGQEPDARHEQDGQKLDASPGQEQDGGQELDIGQKLDSSTLQTFSLPPRPPHLQTSRPPHHQTSEPSDLQTSKPSDHVQTSRPCCRLP
jgi:hypothetical protein